MTWRDTARHLRADVLEALSVRAEWTPKGELRDAFEAAVKELQRAAGMGEQGRLL
jgi:hypothetical protein